VLLQLPVDLGKDGINYGGCLWVKSQQHFRKSEFVEYDWYELGTAVQLPCGSSASCVGFWDDNHL
jgi:hypothetical protein